MNQDTIILNWIYVAVMLIGALIISIMSRNPKGVPKIDYFISLFIPMWSAIAYMAIVTLTGVINLDNETIFYARYLDWIVTTPLLLTLLCFTGMYYSKKDKTIIFRIVLSGIIMILCGLIGSLSVGNNRYIWFCIGLISFFIILCIIWGPIEDIASTQGCEVYRLYKKLALYITIFWMIYAIAWIIGPLGFGLLSQKFDIYLFMIIPIFSKLGFSLLDVIGLRKLEANKYT